MKKKIAALLLCAVLSATSFPVTGMAGEFSATSEDVSQETPDPEITPTVKPARTPKVTASVVKGLEKPLKSYPGQFYNCLHIMQVPSLFFMLYPPLFLFY